MPVDTAFERLRNANPVPYPAALRERPTEATVFLVATQQRSTQMQTKLEPLTTRKAPTPQWRKWVPALAAFVVVILVGVSIALFTSGSDPDVAGSGASPVETATSFIEAQDAWDAEAAVSLLAPDAMIDHGLVSQVEEYPSVFAWYEALDWRWAAEECTQTAFGPPAQVLCTLTHENAWTQALGVGPFGGSSIVFVIAHGQIQELENRFSDLEFSPQAWGVFAAWVGVNHPEGVTAIYDRSNPRVDIPVVTPEALVLWEQYTNEFVVATAP